VKKLCIFFLYVSMIFCVTLFSQEILEEYRLGNYIESLTYIRNGPHQGTFAVIDGTRVFKFDPENSTYELLFPIKDFMLKPWGLIPQGISYISQGVFSGNFLMNHRSYGDTLFIVSTSGDLVAEVSCMGFDWDFKEDITEIVSGPYEGCFAMFAGHYGDRPPPDDLHIFIFSINEVDGDGEAILVKDIIYDYRLDEILSLTFLPDTYPDDSSLRNHLVLSDLVWPWEDSNTIYRRVIDFDYNFNDDNPFKATYEIDSNIEGMAYIEDGPYQGKFLAADGLARDIKIVDLDDSNPIPVEGITAGIAFPLPKSMTWQADTDELLLTRIPFPLFGYNYICPAKRKGFQDWTSSPEAEYNEISFLTDITKKTDDGFYYLIGIDRTEQGTVPKIQVLDSNFHYRNEIPLLERYNDICLISDPYISQKNLFALNPSSDTTKIRIFDESFQSKLYEFDLSDQVIYIRDMCFDANTHEFYLLVPGNKVLAFDFGFSLHAECCAADQTFGRFSEFSKITSGELKGKFIFLTELDSETFVIDLEPEMVLSRIGLLKKAVDESGIPSGVKNALLSLLEAAHFSEENNNCNAAVNKLEAFIQLVEAQSGKKIPVQTADHWIAWAQRIIEILQDLM